jgi:hypothetical protein
LLIRSCGYVSFMGAPYLVVLERGAEPVPLTLVFLSRWCS